MEIPKILIVDDEPDVCFILERSFRSDGYAIESVQDGRLALEKIVQTTYDLILLDLNMKPINGLQVMSHLRQQGQDAVVIILTAHSTLQSAVEALRLGAFDYLFKPATPEMIRQRVREGLQHRQQNLRRQRLLAQVEQLKQALSVLDEGGGAFAPPSLSDRFLSAGKLVIDRHHRSATLDGNLLDLTTTEFNLLLSLVSAAPAPITPRQLVQEALNYDCEEAEASEIIKGHIYHLRQKIEPDPTSPQYIKTVRYKGYLWSG